MTVEGRHGGTAAGYRGDDRRPVDDEAWALHHRLGGGLVLLAGLGMLVLAVGPARFAAAVSLPALTAQGVLAATLVAVALAHHRVTGRAHERGLAVAATVLTLQVGAAHLGADPTVPAVLGIGAAWGLGRAVWGPEVDATPAVRRSLLTLGLVLGVGLVVAVLGPASPNAVTALVTVEGAAWAFVAGLGFARVRVRGWGFMAWGAWLALAHAGDGLGRAAGHAAGMGEVGPPLLAVAGLAIAVYGGLYEVSRVAVARRGDVHGLVLAQHADRAAVETARRATRHEIRNAVVAIDGAAMSLALSDEPLPVGDRDRLHRTLQASIDGLRSLADPAPVAAPDEYRLDEVVAARADVAELRGIRVVTEAADPVLVAGDRSPVARLVDNLILNAARHGDAGSEAHPVVVRVEEADRQARVLVVDDGPGVPAADRDRIFEANHRGHPDRPGDGLGLYVAREIAQGQGGAIAYEPRTGGGARFVLTLPAGRRSAGPARGPRRHEVENG